MNREITVEPFLPHAGKMPDYEEQLAIKIRRARWFDYVRRRFDLWPLEKVLDWSAREPNGITIDTQLRSAAAAAMMDSIRLGEFDGNIWPAIAYLPKYIPTDRLARFPMRLSVGQIAWFDASGHDMLPDLWSPRGLCLRWLEGRRMAVPPWLKLELHEPLAIQQAPARTGLPGRPSSRHLIVEELRSRAFRGEMDKASIANEARTLAAWLRAAHPTMPTVGAKTLQNNISSEWRALGGVSRKEIK